MCQHNLVQSCPFLLSKYQGTPGCFPAGQCTIGWVECEPATPKRIYMCREDGTDCRTAPLYSSVRPTYCEQVLEQIRNLVWGENWW